MVFAANPKPAKTGKQLKPGADRRLPTSIVHGIACAFL
jgi:hypothetical protein